jgi:hypothetical protein
VLSWPCRNFEKRFPERPLPTRKSDKHPGEDMSVPPAFPKSFYVKLAAAAKEFGLSRVQFVMDALKYYTAEIRRKNRSPATKALGSAAEAKKFAEMSSKVSKSWWSTLTPEEKRARGQKAVQARWAKTKKTAVNNEEESR